MADETDVVDQLRAKQKLSASNIVFVVELFTRTRETLALIDPGFLALYLASTAASKHITTMTRFFSGDRQRPVILLPLHNDGHWSLLIYVARYTTFFYFDSLDEYHDSFAVRVLTKFVEDGVLTNASEIKMMTIRSDTQAHSYECGQYVFMFLHAFLVSQSAEKPPFDRDGFVNILQTCVRERCREQHRQVFIQRVIQWIHEERGF